MPFVTIAGSPLVPEKGDVALYYRDAGSGYPLLYLHGGWGYDAYPFDRQMEALGERFRILIPDRSGYGKSGRIGVFPIDFHRRAAGEMIRFLDALGVNDCALWGHSDGAVIAAWMGMENPGRFPGIILEALHFYRNKPASRSFFENAASNPDGLGERIGGILSRAHGEDYWRDLICNASDAWLRLADEAPRPDADLFDGGLASLTAPVLVLHGAQDPRTEPDEIERVRKCLPHALFHVIESAGHSPHSESASFKVCTRYAADFLSR